MAKTKARAASKAKPLVKAANKPKKARPSKLPRVKPAPKQNNSLKARRNSKAANSPSKARPRRKVNNLQKALAPKVLVPKVPGRKAITLKVLHAPQQSKPYNRP